MLAILSCGDHEAAGGVAQAHLLASQVDRGGEHRLIGDGRAADRLAPGTGRLVAFQEGNPDRFLRLPHAFWRDGWHERLNLPATAMLLVALHEKTNFELPATRSPAAR